MEAENTNTFRSQDRRPAEWPELQTQAHEKPSDSEEASFFEAEDGCKIKPEIELKEETEGFVYKADFRGHLQLVSLNQDLHNHCNASENNLSGKELNNSIDSTYCPPYCLETFNEKSNTNSTELIDMYRISGNTKEWPTSDEGQPVLVSWNEDLKYSERSQVCRHLKALSPESPQERFYIKEEPSENNYKHPLPEIYDYSSDSTWEPQSDNSSQIPRTPTSLKLNGKSILLTQAEKKRLYRMRIREENPLLWSTIKKKEAARKREQREKRRHILYEMQKAMELSTPTNSDCVNQKLYLEALKGRYPELWNQLLTALPATQLRNEQIFNERSNKSKRHCPKPAKMYKDVIEAQKKRLYRQRIKEERPEMYQRQKARDAYARSIQRLTQKKNSENRNELNLESLHPNDVENKSNYLQNLQAGNYQLMSSKTTQLVEDSFNPDSGVKNVHCMSHTTKTPHPNTSSENTIESSSKDKSDPSLVCDNKHSERGYNVIKPAPHSNDDNISDEAKEPRNVNRNSFPNLTACSTQSDILWYWNDFKGNQFVEELLPPVPYVPWRRGPQLLTEEERLQKILKERMRLKEKRRRYRMNMTPERRMEFLEIERERLKMYRLKKKAAEAVSD